MAEVNQGKTVRRLLLVVAGMFAFGFAMVPLYDIICEVTGLNGKTAGQYGAAETQVLREDRLVTIQFLANNNADMPWEFRPGVRKLQVHPGKMNTAEFYVRNATGKTMVAQAVPSVAPFRAAEYLHKTECFCFVQQQLAAGEEAKLPLRFIIDSGIPEDVTTLTLSYTLYDVTEQADIMAQAGASG